MKLRTRVVLPLVLLVLQGCASVAVQRANDLSSAAIAYTDTTAAVIDLALDAAIDSDSEVEVMRLKNDAKPGSDEAQLRRSDQLKLLDGQLVKRITLYTALRHSVHTVKAYFAALQTLANGSTAEATGAAVESLGQRVNAVSKAIEGADAKARLSEAKIAALGGLAKVVAAQVHGAKVAGALQRDAELIGRALALQNKVLLVAGEDIRAKLQRDSEGFYADRVQRPHRVADIGPAWVDDRRTALKVRALGHSEAALNSAAAAAEQMEAVWQRLLSGDFSAQEVLATLKDTEDLLDAAQALKDANKAK